MKETNAKAADTEKKRTNLSRTEEQLNAQLVKLQKENQEARSRIAHQATQYKALQTRIQTVEAAGQSLEQKLKDAETEVEFAHKSCRSYQFRIQQLQEEVVFLEKRKKAESETMKAIAPAAPESSPGHPASSALPQTQTQQQEEDVDIPAWMQ